MSDILNFSPEIISKMNNKQRQQHNKLITDIQKIENEIANYKPSEKKIVEKEIKFNFSSHSLLDFEEFIIDWLQNCKNIFGTDADVSIDEWIEGADALICTGKALETDEECNERNKIELDNLNHNLYKLKFELGMLKLNVEVPLV